MKHSILIFCFLFLSYGSDYTNEHYFIGNDTIIFCVKNINSINKDNDKDISRYIKNFSGKLSYPVNESCCASVKKNAYLLFFWKNLGKNEWGFVIADFINSDVWKTRLNGQDYWTNIEPGEEESFRWFTEGRSVGVTLINDQSSAITYIFCGDVDF